MNHRKDILLFVLLISVFLSGCTQKTYESIEFKSRAYQFNEQILNTFRQSGEIGLAATDLSFVSEYKLLLESLEKKDSIKMPLPDSIWSIVEDNPDLCKARDYILKEAAQHEIVMFNENHFLPRHRHFVKSLLPELYKLGYRYLAVEAIGMLGDGTMYDKDLSKRGYPIRYTGHYIKEPEFSMLIREAIKLNFSIVGYDEGSSYGFSGGDREERGADNILAQVDFSDAGGKLIVLCGWDHLKEGNSGTYWEYALAERLKQKTGKDPLTINQTEYNERLNRKYEKPLMQRVETDHSIVLLDKSHQPLDFSKDTGWYDLFVVHPRTNFKEGIPDWIVDEGPLNKYDLSSLELQPPYKILVYESSDDVKLAAPIFVSEVADVTQKIALPTRGKEIKLVVTNKKKSVIVE